jgi:hypothetical protein
MHAGFTDLPAESAVTYQTCLGLPADTAVPCLSVETTIFKTILKKCIQSNLAAQFMESYSRKLNLQ